MEYASLPGYVTECRHRDVAKGGGVGAYIKDNMKYKRRMDIEELQPKLEHLWLEVPGRNKNSIHCYFQGVNLTPKLVLKKKVQDHQFFGGYFDPINFTPILG